MESLLGYSPASSNDGSRSRLQAIKSQAEGETMAGPAAGND
jgi:hypothetical protein